MRQSLAIVGLCLFLTGCAAFVIEDANRLQKGMSSSEVLGKVSKGPSRTFNITLPNEPQTRIEIMSFVLSNAGTSAEYYAAFENDKLLYWGFPYEFNRYPDPRYNEIGRLARETQD